MLRKKVDSSEKVGFTPKSFGRASFEELVGRITEGSETAVWEMLERYSHSIRRAIRRRLPTELQHRIDSADIVQSVWKSLLRQGIKPGQFNTPEDFVAYLSKMAKWKLYETHRRFTKFEGLDVRRETSGLGTDARIADRRIDSPSSIAQVREKWELALKSAGLRGQQVLQLKLQGLTLDEIAQQASLSKATVRRDIGSLLASLQDEST